MVGFYSDANFSGASPGTSPGVKGLYSFLVFSLCLILNYFFKKQNYQTLMRYKTAQIFLKFLMIY